MKLIGHLNISSWLNINLNFVYPVVHVKNTNPVPIYLKIISHIQIWIRYIYKLDNFKETWKSINTYKLPKQVFFEFVFNIFYYLICKY